MSSFTKREQIVILVIVFIIILGLSFKFIIKDIIKPKNTIMEIKDSDDLPEDEHIEEILIEEDEIIMVHISGQVYKPGIVQLESGKRLVDAVELAGGLKKDADLDRMNLAKKLLDEEKIYIPKIGEIVGGEVEIISTNSLTSTQSNESIKVNVNTCDKKALVSLPGIGDVIADRIIDYRSSNQFKSIEDIKSVSGIGDKKFDGIKELIIVN